MINKVKLFLEGRGVSAYQFIKETGISASAGYALARDANHLPSIRVLEVICDTYEIEPSEIIQRTPKKQRRGVNQ